MAYRPELDFRLARRSTALSQADLAHLLAVDQPRISKFERGKARPSTAEVATLDALFGRPLDTASLQILAERRDELLSRLRTIPDCPKSWRTCEARVKTLGAFSDFLADLDVDLYD